MGVHYGAKLQAGISYSMSAATSDKLESMRRTLLQELAHHVENCAAGVSEVVYGAFARMEKRPITLCPH
jgi:hypothetical protein